MAEEEEEEEEVAAVVGKEMREEEGEKVFLEGHPNFSHGPLNVLTGPARRSGASVTQHQQRWIFMKYGASTRWKTSLRSLLTGNGSRVAAETQSKHQQSPPDLLGPGDTRGHPGEGGSAPAGCTVGKSTSPVGTVLRAASEGDPAQTQPLGRALKLCNLA